MRVTTEQGRISAARRIYYIHFPLLASTGDFAVHLDRAAALGFDTILLSPIFQPGVDGDVFSTRDHGRAHRALGGGDATEALRGLSGQAEERGLQLFMDLALHRLAPGHPLVTARPDLFHVTIGAAVDPRHLAPASDEARPRLDTAEAAHAVADFARAALAGWAAAGLRGLRVLQPHAAPPAFWRALIRDVRSGAPDMFFLAETQAASREAVLALAECGFDALTSSLPWWDGRARWFVEEHEALRAIAPLIAELEPPFGPRLSTRHSDPAEAALAYEQRLTLAAATGVGLLAPMGFETASHEPLDPRGGDAKRFAEGQQHSSTDLREAVRAANGLSRELSRFDGEMRVLTGEGAPVTVLLRANAADVRRATAALLILINPDLRVSAAPAGGNLLAQAGAEFEPFERVDGGSGPFDPLRPGEVRLLLARRGRAIADPLVLGPVSARAAALAPRLVVEGVSPMVEGGAFPVRRIVGERVQVEADVFGDGHEHLAAELQWRWLDQAGWNSVPMTALENDRWSAAFPLDRLGRYEFAVEAWLDRFGGFRRDYAKKRDAGVTQPVDAKEGGELVKRACKRASGEVKDGLKDVLARLNGADHIQSGDILLEPGLADLMRLADDRPFRLRSPAQLVDAERLQARFASWYELFPRSQTDHAERHGTFDDVIARLPAVRAMGFDVLYFPPIHPIGRKNRKGRNNSLTPAPDDPGSPYAIGSADGGHEAIHPELGTFEDFRRLIGAAAGQGLEIALDFAIQCSPDHPWLQQHPGWFDWRPDGSIKYAENPPKKYQDIVNVDFYKPDAIPDLWLALRDNVLLWVGEGIRLFRVDNPHTKPLPFWEWMIREVRSAHPDVVFLAEAFTRPKVMYRLAKIGFSQSYSYFTWRDTKAEFTDYLTELTQTAPKEFFRPHFFVNTPDINPVFLQTSGRGGFLIRAALAATLSGLWGVYSGFELLEAEPVPGKEEYKDSEKYEIRPRPPRAPGDIVTEITRLNRIRKGHPALQTHLGVAFLPAWNENVLVFAKATAGLDDVIVVAISLDPQRAQETGFELPLWAWGLGDDAAVEVEDLIWETRSAWTGKSQYVRLDPGQPYAVWSLRLPTKVAS